MRVYEIVERIRKDSWFAVSCIMWFVFSGMKHEDLDFSRTIPISRPIKLICWLHQQYGKIVPTICMSYHCTPFRCHCTEIRATRLPPSLVLLASFGHVPLTTAGFLGHSFRFPSVPMPQLLSEEYDTTAHSNM